MEPRYWKDGILRLSFFGFNVGAFAPHPGDGLPRGHPPDLDRLKRRAVDGQGRIPSRGGDGPLVRQLPHHPGPYHHLSGRAASGDFSVHDLRSPEGEGDEGRGVGVEKTGSGTLA